MEKKMIPLGKDLTVPAQNVSEKRLKEVGVKAWFSDDLLTVDLPYPMDCVSVTLTHLDSGSSEWDSYKYMGRIDIALGSFPEGNYLVKVLTCHGCLFGKFQK